MRATRAITSLAAALMWLVCAMVAHAGEVIAHPSVNLSVEEIRNVFLGEKQLAGRLRLVPVDNLSVQDEFLAKVLQTDLRKYQARWLRKAFREGMAAPAAKGSDAEVISFVRTTPGAIGYIGGGGAEGVKVIEDF